MFFEDRLGKPGWIASEAGLVSKGLNERRGGSNLSMTFGTGIATREQSQKRKLNNFHIDVSYMRTWKDAGVVDVFICDTLVGHLIAPP